jgi:hypothetical protein
MARAAALLPGSTLLSLVREIIAVMAQLQAEQQAEEQAAAQQQAADQRFDDNCQTLGGTRRRRSVRDLL